MDVNCVYVYGPCTPIFGRDKFIEQQKSFFRNIPDCCVIYTNVVRSKKRLITMKGNCFGTFPYANTSDNTINSWNIFENTPIDKFDEHHKIQKQKYDLLKSQNKIMRFEPSLTGHVMLSRDLNCFIKLMSFNLKVAVY